MYLYIFRNPSVGTKNNQPLAIKVTIWAVLIHALTLKPQLRVLVMIFITPSNLGISLQDPFSMAVRTWSVTSSLGPYYSEILKRTIHISNANNTLYYHVYPMTTCLNLVILYYFVIKHVWVILRKASQVRLHDLGQHACNN